ncbi:hypothetical protein A3A74_02610 [Candidatus Roizmanbacteria bacterium RIFCSPLOWO2_01_FULL_35_13]|uniref:Uncharacterized protein n=1 Tax=Candidatus Roizmanbacteria bacterium RIFCSPLOWO2_01_FULL_35_13 TaxID=1802055 RepID=A0A1F7I8W7_9BACT|nr:MAG: hypothetical protein A3A74_02610 [Candidatus Roizmanbacteria bacterium RIFCSPLOWO2_01_FULL_35_13]
MFWADKLFELGTSFSALKVYSSFCSNLAAASFLSIFISASLVDLTIRIFSFIIYLTVAIFFERKSK